MLGKVNDEAKSKSPHVRAKIASYFLLMLLFCEPLSLKQNMDTVEEFLQKYLQDAKPEVRLISRLCFVQYKSLVLASRSLKLQRSLTASNQRALEDLPEEPIYQILQQYRQAELDKLKSAGARSTSNSGNTG